MHRLTYISLRQRHVTDQEIIDGIVLPAIPRNRRAEITGCLWFSEEHFVHTMEGSEAVIRSVYTRICEDRRHHSCRVICDEAISERAFAQHPMKVIKRGEPSSAAAELQAASGGMSVSGAQSERIAMLAKQLHLHPQPMMPVAFDPEDGCPLAQHIVTLMRDHQHPLTREA